MTTEQTKLLSDLYAVLPGPDRKRLQSKYSYRLTYRNPDPTASGCLMLWEVYGGRMEYQIALELEAGALRFHCTCADAIFRAVEQGRFCKHVHGLLHLTRPVQSGDQSLPIGA
jgi:hypothetical protein